MVSAITLSEYSRFSNTSISGIMTTDIDDNYYFTLNYQ